MPLYDYDCETCGGFAAERSMAEYDLPHDCPACGGPAPRVLAVPAFALMDAGRRAAIGVNERSAAAPRRSAGTGAHPPRCPCCTGASGQGAFRSRSGAKSFPRARPWMISH